MEKAKVDTENIEHEDLGFKMLLSIQKKSLRQGYEHIQQEFNIDYTSSSKTKKNNKQKLLREDRYVWKVTFIGNRFSIVKKPVPPIEQYWRFLFFQGGRGIGHTLRQSHAIGSGRKASKLFSR